MELNSSEQQATTSLTSCFFWLLTSSSFLQVLLCIHTLGIVHIWTLNMFCLRMTGSCVRVRDCIFFKYQPDGADDSVMAQAVGLLTL